MITFEPSKYGIECKVNGLRFCVLTNNTPQEEIDRFKSACEGEATKLSEIVTAYEAAIAHNFANPDDARDWPVFKQRERLVDRLLNEAGIVST